MKNGSDSTDAIRQMKSPKSKLTNGTLPTRTVLRMQDLRIPRKIPVVISPFCLSPLISGMVVLMNAAEMQITYGEHFKIIPIENAALDVQPTAKATRPNPAALASKSRIGLPFSLMGGTEYSTPRIMESSMRYTYVPGN